MGLNSVASELRDMCWSRCAAGGTVEPLPALKARLCSTHPSKSLPSSLAMEAAVCLGLLETLASIEEAQRRSYYRQRVPDSAIPNQKLHCDNLQPKS